MNRWIKVGLLGGALGVGTMFACGGDDLAPPKVPTPPTSAVPSAAASSVPSAAPSAIASAAPSATPSASAAPTTPPMSATFHAFTRAATSGKVDKVGQKDGAFKADGVKDQVFDLDIEGPGVSAIFVMTCDKEGTLTSEFDADTLVGGQRIPADIAGILNQGRNTAGLAVYEGDKLLNRPDGGVTLGDGRHKLVLNISAKEYPTGPVRVFALLPDGTLAKGPVLAK